MKFLTVSILLFVSCALLGQDSLKVLSYNIFMLPKKSLMLNKNNQRAKNLIPKLDSSNYDVLVLQEVFDKKIDRQLKKKLSSTYPYQLGHDSKGGLVKTHAGLRIYSKFPVNFIDQITFQKGTGIDRLAKKGAVLFKVTKSKKEYFLVNTHMQSEEGTPQQQRRLLQLGQIIEMINKNTDSSQVTFILGDFNFHQKDEMIELLDDNAGFVVEEILKKEIYTYPAESFSYNYDYKKTLDLCLQLKGERIGYDWKPVDFFYLSKNERQDCSDHRAISVILR